MKKEMICISCPIGCPMTVDYEEINGKIDASSITVTGNSCKRGVAYAKDEISAPKRMITTTVPVTGGGMIPVKTSAPVPKEQIFNVLYKVKGCTAVRPISIGQIIVSNVFDGIDLIATGRLD